MKATTIGNRTIDPAKDDFFRVVIEERKSLPKSHPHYLLLKIIANALYGIFAELNKEEFGKNNAKRLNVFSGEYKFDQTTFVVERPGRWQFPPAAALITAGGRLMRTLSVSRRPLQASRWKTSCQSDNLETGRRNLREAQQFESLRPKRRRRHSQN